MCVCVCVCVCNWTKLTKLDQIDRSELNGPNWIWNKTVLTKVDRIGLNGPNRPNWTELAKSTIWTK